MNRRMFLGALPVLPVVMAAGLSSAQAVTQTIRIDRRAHWESVVKAMMEAQRGLTGVALSIPTSAIGPSRTV